MTEAFDRLKAALADRYTIERELGAGGMATVYLADDLKHHRKVAVKVLRPELAAALGADRFFQEIEIAAQLTHPHVLPLHDSGEADGFLYYVMPYIEGESLRDKLAKEGELPIAEAVRILRDVVEALKHAHKHNVVHRDIKPDNVMLAEDHALVTDFGVAKAVSDATGAIGLTTEGVALGTPAYMAPEQASADPHIDHRADLYAVGVIAYELLTGRTPFVGTTQQELLAAHVTQVPDHVTKYRESVPPALAELVMRCLEKKAADRWQSAGELLPHLEALATPSGGVTPTGMMPVGAARRGWKLAVVAGAVAVLLAVVLIVMLLPRGSRVTLDPDRVLVAVFENQTGDPSLDPLGAMAGHWITQGLQRSGVVQVVPWLEAQQASQYVASEVAAGNARNRVTTLAEETGAATVISGAYYRRGETVQYQVEVTDALRRQSLAALNPEIAPLGSPDDAIEPLVQRVMGFLAISLDERISDQASSLIRPPSFEAYQEFDQGLAIYLRDPYDQDALPHWHRAFELDTTFVDPLIYATLVHNNNRQWAQSDSLVGVLEQRADWLTEYDRHWLDYHKARVDGDHEEALRAMRRAAELAPGSKAVYNRAFIALQMNRPQEALDALLSLNPERGPMRGNRAYWNQLTWAHIALGLYEEGLKVLEGAKSRFAPHSNWPIWEIHALVALGRIGDLNKFLEEVTAQSIIDENGTVAWSLSFATEVLTAYGYADVAMEVANQAIEWFEALPPGRYTINHSVVLFFAGRVEEAQAVVSASADDPNQSDVGYRGYRGFYAATRSDTVQALRDLEWLANLDTPYLHGRDKFWRAAIVGALGNHEAAVNMFRQAFREGQRVFTHTPYWVELVPLRDHPEFQEFMRPKG